MSELSKKQLGEVLERIEGRGESPVPLDDTTMVKRYGEQQHVIVRSQLAGCEGELVLDHKSLCRLGQVLIELSKQRPVGEVDNEG